MWVKTPGKGFICTVSKVYWPPLPYNYKETEIPEDLSNLIECLFRDYVRSLEHSNSLLTPRDDVVWIYVSTDKK